MEYKKLENIDDYRESLDRELRPYKIVSTIMFILAILTDIAIIVLFICLFNYFKDRPQNSVQYEEGMVDLFSAIIGLIFESFVCLIVRLCTRKNHPGVAAGFTMGGYWFTIFGLVSAVLLWKVSTREKYYLDYRRGQIDSYNKEKQKANEAILYVNDLVLKVKNGQLSRSGLVVELKYNSNKVKEYNLLVDKMRNNLTEKYESSQISKVEYDYSMEKISEALEIINNPQSTNVISEKRIFPISELEGKIEKMDSSVRQEYLKIKSYHEQGIFGDDEYYNKLCTIVEKEEKNIKDLIVELEGKIKEKGLTDNEMFKKARDYYDQSLYSEQEYYKKIKEMLARVEV